MTPTNYETHRMVSTGFEHFLRFFSEPNPRDDSRTSYAAVGSPAPKSAHPWAPRLDEAKNRLKPRLPTLYVAPGNSPAPSPGGTGSGAADRPGCSSCSSKPITLAMRY